MSYQRVENVLKRAKELQNIGQYDGALNTLYSTIMHKRYRTLGWDAIKEQVMMSFVEFSVDMEKLKYIRDGLYQYRTISHHFNILSFGKVIVLLRTKAEERFAKTKEDHGVKTLQKGLNQDLDEGESPEALMLSTLQAEVRDASSLAVSNAFRFLWEVYKMIMDILKNTPKLETTYHETAQRALIFCKDNERHAEFRRLCDTLRINYLQLLKYHDKPEFAELLRPELHLETRMTQLNVAAELGLWKESSSTAEDICNLGLHDVFLKSLRYKGDAFQKSKESLRWIAVYYEKLSKIFWVSHNYLFHALACVKYLLHVRNFKRSVVAKEMEQLCTTAMLAVLAIPASSREGKPDELSPGNVKSQEQAKKMAALLGHPSIPTRESLKYALSYKDIFSQSSDVCQKLYSMMETDFTPLKLCAECQPLLEKLEEDPNCAQYVMPLKRVIFRNLILQLSKVYTSVSIDYLTTHICPENFYRWDDAEQVIVSLVYQGHFDLRFDYAKRAIYFGAATMDPAATMRYELANFGKSLQLAVLQLQVSLETENDLKNKAHFYADMKKNLVLENERLIKRNQLNNSRRNEEATEQKKHEDLKQKELHDQLQEELEKEKLRKEEAKRMKEEKKLKEEDIRLKSDIAVQMLDMIKAMRPGLLIKGKVIEEITVAQVLNGKIEVEDIEKSINEQLVKERADRTRQRKLEARKMDHFIRACRQEELPKLNEWCRKIYEEDTNMLLALQDSIEAEQRALHKEALAEKHIFQIVLAEKVKWEKVRMAQRVTQYTMKVKQQRERIIAHIKHQKLERARQAREEYHAELLRKQEEEELAREQELNQARKAAKEQEKRLLDEQAQKRLQRELDAEKRSMMEYEKLRDEQMRGETVSFREAFQDRLQAAPLPNYPSTEVGTHDAPPTPARTPEEMVRNRRLAALEEDDYHSNYTPYASMRDNRTSGEVSMRRPRHTHGRVEGPQRVDRQSSRNRDNSLDVKEWRYTRSRVPQQTSQPNPEVNGI